MKNRLFTILFTTITILVNVSVFFAQKPKMPHALRPITLKKFNNDS